MVHDSNLNETKPAHVSSPLGIAVAGLTALGVIMGIGRFAFTPILAMMQQPTISVTYSAPCLNSRGQSVEVRHVARDCPDA